MNYFESKYIALLYERAMKFSSRNNNLKMSFKATTWR